MIGTTRVMADPAPVADDPAVRGADVPGHAGRTDPEFTGAPRGQPVGWWGMAWLLVTEAMVVAGSLSAWHVIRAGSGDWPQGGLAPPGLLWPGVATAVLLVSCLPVLWALAAVRRGALPRARAALAASWLMGAAFVAHQAFLLDGLGVTPGDIAYASLFYVIVGVHALHVAVGLVMSAVVQLKAGTGRLGPDRHLTLKVFALYWSFGGVVGLVLFLALHLHTGFS